MSFMELKANCSISESHSVCLTQNNREHRAEIKAPAEILLAFIDFQQEDSEYPFKIVLPSPVKIFTVRNRHLLLPEIDLKENSDVQLTVKLI